jgi:hypothetical protein
LLTIQMNASFLSIGVVALLGFCASVRAQTSCGIQHTGSGVFICDPDPSEYPADATIPELFHVSAQANAPEGVTTRHYSVFLDNDLLYDNRLATPVERLSIEINLRAPSKSGAHTLRIAVSDVGNAEVKGIQFRPSAAAGFCDPLSRVETFNACFAVMKAPLSWSIERPAAAGASQAAAAGYTSYLELYRRNLKSLEADIADAVAVDSQGDLYVALHMFNGLELRKYTPNRSIVYDSVIQACGEGFLEISGLAVDNGGHAWMAGNTTACLSGTAGAWKARVSDTLQPHGFVLLLDTSKPVSTAPLYLTYLADVDNEISDIRVDSDGNAYVTGTTTSGDFPHKASVGLQAGHGQPGDGGPISFVSVLDKSGSSLQWSTLVRDVRLTALALDGERNVYLAGRTGGDSDAVLARLSRQGDQLLDTTRLGRGDARAIAISGEGPWTLIEGESQSLALALKACVNGKASTSLLPQDENSAGTEISQQLALDAFASHLPSGPPCQAGSQ